MAGPFVSDEMFPIVIKYVEKNSKLGMTSVLILKGEEMEQRYKGSAKTINTQWALPNWKESNDLVRGCYRWDNIAGEKILDWSLYRMKVLDTYMRNCDIKSPGQNGEETSIPCTPEYISKLQPSIAGALVDEFMAKTSPSEEDLGN